VKKRKKMKGGQNTWKTGSPKGGRTRIEERKERLGKINGTTGEGGMKKKTKEVLRTQGRPKTRKGGGGLRGG